MNIKLTEVLGLSTRDVQILESLSIVKEITLNLDNAAPIDGGLEKGTFQVGDVLYSYTVNDFDFPFVLPGDRDEVRLEPLTVDIGFSVKGDVDDLTSNLPKGGKENLIKIYSTIFKIVADVAKGLSPNNILVSSYDASGYFPIYNNLTKTNSISGYSRKTIIKWNNEGRAATSIVLKKNN
jgi:hypothetical protein